MKAPKLGLITFGDERPHEWEKVFRRLTEGKHAEALAFFRGLNGAVELHAFDAVARTRTDIDGQVAALRAAGAEVLAAHVPCWTAPNLVLHGVDTEGYHRYATEHDLVVLAVGMQPETDGVQLPDDIVLDSSGFIEGCTSGGQFGAGAASGPLDVNRSVQSATAAALRGIQVVHRAMRAEKQ